MHPVGRAVTQWKSVAPWVGDGVLKHLQLVSDSGILRPAQLPEDTPLHRFLNSKAEHTAYVGTILLGSTGMAQDLFQHDFALELLSRAFDYSSLTGYALEFCLNAALAVRDVISTKPVPAHLMPLLVLLSKAGRLFNISVYKYVVDVIGMEYNGAYNSAWLFFLYNYHTKKLFMEYKQDYLTPIVNAIRSLYKVFSAHPRGEIICLMLVELMRKTDWNFHVPVIDLHPISVLLNLAGIESFEGTTEMMVGFLERVITDGNDHWLLDQVRSHTYTGIDYRIYRRHGRPRRRMGEELMYVLPEYVVWNKKTIDGLDCYETDAFYQVTLP